MNALELLSQDPYLAAQRAAHVLEGITHQPTHDVAVIFGSGWDVILPLIGEIKANIETEQLPGFLPATVKGHSGRVMSLEMGDRRVLTISRTHLYEEQSPHVLVPMAATVHSIRFARAAGCRSILLTNAVGGLNPEMKVGQAMIISDHNTLFVPSPLTGPRFVQCHNLYSQRLRDLADELGLPEGIYGQVHGPHFESPAECRALKLLGADIVGMSIGTEAIAAADVGLEVLAMSCITDVAGTETSHDEVLAIVRQTANQLGPGIVDVIKHM